MKREPPIIWLGWVLFVLCLFLPAFSVGKDEPIYGWRAAAISLGAIAGPFHKVGDAYIALAGFANLALLLGPAQRFVRSSRTLARLTAASWVVAAYIGSLYFLFDSMMFMVGYYVWLIAATVFAIAMTTVNRRKGNLLAHAE